MGVASYNTDLTDLVADSASTGNWAALGGGASGLNIETDYFIEGTRCVSKNAWAGAAKGMVEDTTNNLLTALSGKAVYTWITHLTPGSLAVKASGGIAIALGSASNALNLYNYAGSDTIDYGAPWICAVVDPDEGTQASGTVTTANIDTYGGQANLPTTGPTKGAPLGIDEIRYGRSIEINDGVGAAANFTDLAVQNDLLTNRWGQFQRTPGSTKNFTQQCRLEFGDTTNITACEFEDSDKNITIANLEHVASDFIEHDVTQGSDVTLTNINFDAVAGGNTRGNWVTTSAGTIVFNNINFTNYGFSSYASGYTINDGTYRGARQITSNGTTFNGATFDSMDLVASTAAVVTDDLGDIGDADFTRGTNGYAVELTSIGAGSMSWNATLSGYRAGTTGSPITPTNLGDEAIFVNVGSGTLTINVDTGATVPSIRSAGAVVNIVAGQVTTSVTTKDNETKAVIPNVAVIIRATDGTGPLPYKDSVTITRSGSIATVSHIAHGIPDGKQVEIEGADQNEYNRAKVITVIDVDSYSFVVSGTPTTPATGTITATGILINGLTDALGVISDTRTLNSDQPITGNAIKGDTSPVYVTSPISDVVDSSNGKSISILMIPD